MALSSNMISQLTKVTRFTEKPKGESTLYGTIVRHQNVLCVKLDGANEGVLTPIDGIESVSSTMYKEEDRVIVTIKNHTAVVTGNITDKSITSTNFETLANTVTKFDGIVSNVVQTDVLLAQMARIDQLETDMIDVTGELNAASGNIEQLQATDVQVKGRLDAHDASIGTLTTCKLDVNEAEARYARIGTIEAVNANVDKLSASQATFENTTTAKLAAIDGTITNLDSTYANIDFSNIGKAAMEWFYAQSGLIKDVTIDNGTITGNLVGVTISGDLIEGNTVKAEKLVIKGSDGLYYKLNTDGMTTEAQQTDQNSINGSVIKAKSITASKISVSDLVAFDATIGGFHITSKAIYSGVKETVSNTTQGLYLDSDGQMAVGDSSRYLKYYKKQDGTYALEISADSVILGASGKNVETAIEDVQANADAATESNQKRIESAEALIELLSESISMLVTDGSGASLMKQTDGGWTFSTGDLQDMVNRTSEALDTLTNDVDGVHNTVDILQQAVRDLGTLSDYIKIGTYENEPCIELGESDSDFKLLITNTRIMFREGTGVPAYFTNQSMHIKKAVVEEELQQGGFVWKARANGNLGLVWKGVTS